MGDRGLQPCSEVRVDVVCAGTGGVGSLTKCCASLMQFRMDHPSVFPQIHNPRTPHPLHCVSDYTYISTTILWSTCFIACVMQIPALY